MRVMLSYPKSGRTWMRFMVDSYLCRLFELDCRNVFEAEHLLRGRMPVEWTHLTGAMVMRRYYWEMGPLALNGAEGGLWVLLTRNFRATLASAYYQARDRVRVFEGTPAQFVRDPRYGIIKLVTFYNMWEQVRPKLPRHTIVSYESLLRDTRNTFTQVLGALRIDIHDALVHKVVAEATFEQMKALSVTEDYHGTVLAPTDPDRPETYKVRQGGQSKSEMFDAEDIAYIDDVVNRLFSAQDDPIYRDCLGEPMKMPTNEQRAAG